MMKKVVNVLSQYIMIIIFVILFIICAYKDYNDSIDSRNKYSVMITVDSEKEESIYIGYIDNIGYRKWLYRKNDDICVTSSLINDKKYYIPVKSITDLKVFDNGHIDINLYY